jgi:hypothetical protein
MNQSTNKRRTRMDAGHSNINQKKLAEYRRDQVFRLSSMGYSQPKIANVLNVSQSLISLDINFLRQKAKEALADYLENKLPLIFEESMAGISDVISTTWEIINNPNVSHHDRLQALSLIADCTERRLDMASNGSIIEDGIRFVQQAKQRIVEIDPEKSKELLHTEEEEKEVQPTKQQHQQEEESEEHKKNEEQEQQKTNNSIF